MPKKYDVILFDMDGTMADTDPMILDTFHFLYQKYRNGKGRPDSEIAYFSGPPIRGTLKNEFPELDEDAIFEEFYQESRKRYDAEHIFLYPHEKEVLIKLKQNGFKLGVVTNKRRDLAIVTLKVLGLEDVFDILLGIDDVVNSKPHPESIERAIKELGGDKKHTLYIGDNKMDYDTAVNSGVDCCIVNWGPRVFPKEIIPTFKINSYLELEEHLYE